LKNQTISFSVKNCLIRAAQTQKWLSDCGYAPDTNIFPSMGDLLWLTNRIENNYTKETWGKYLRKPERVNALWLINYAVPRWLSFLFLGLMSIIGRRRYNRFWGK
jgi:hypothetical protein